MAKHRMWTPTMAARKDRSFWLQDIQADAATAPLSGDVTADVAIVGGGYTGLWTALRLKEQAPELKVVVLEADFCGSGASGRNGGQVHTWFAELDLLSKVVGAEEALQLCHDTAAAIDELEALQTSGTIDMDLRLDGWLWTASSTAQEGAWDSALALCKAAGEEHRFVSLSAADIAARSGSAVSYTGVAETRAGSVQPAKLAIGLRDLALARGVVIHERSPVTEIQSGETCTLRTTDGTLRAGRVVLAANAWLSALPELRRYMFVAETQVIATEPQPETLDRIGWHGGAAICDAQAQVLYYQRTEAGRVVFGRGGGTVAYGGRFGADFNRNPEHGRDNLRELARVYPELRGAKADFDWAGPIDCTAEHIPVFDHLQGCPNIFFGMGFNGTGIAQTPIAGRILASLVLGLTDRWSGSGLVGLYKRTALPPEPIRYIGARIVRHAIRLRNAAEIQNKSANALVRFLSNLKPGS